MEVKYCVAVALKSFCAHLYSNAPFDELMLHCFYVFSHPRLSLAVHPDKITIATGQVAGTSLEGKVSEFQC